MFPTRGVSRGSRLGTFRWIFHLKGSPTHNPCAAPVAVGQRVFLFGREMKNDDMCHIGVYVFNTVSLRWTNCPSVYTGEENLLNAAEHYWAHTAVLIEDVIYMWGRRLPHTGTDERNVLYAFDVDAHRVFAPACSGTAPAARYKPSACALGKAMYIYGGEYTWETECTNAMHKLDTATMVWTLIDARGTPPPAASGHSAAIMGTKMFVFGGRVDHAAGHYNGVRVFDTESDRWLSTPDAGLLPKGHTGHSAFAYNGVFYISGGMHHSATIMDMHEAEAFNYVLIFNPETFSWKKAMTRGRHPSTFVTRGYGMRCSIAGDLVIRFCINHVDILDLSPSLKTLCKLAVIRGGLDQSELPHNLRWELAAMTSN